MQKKIGITLSGGGYRGIIHAGVLQFLKEKKVPVSVISGTSAGGIVGALFASGNSPEQILELFKSVQLFEFTSFSWWKPGLLHTPDFEKYILPHLNGDLFEELDIPLKLVASDLLKGEAVVLDRGSVCQAVLASAAYPGIFVPIEYEGRFLVDGGLFNNLPADIIREEVDIVIGIDVNPITPVSSNDLSSTLSVIRRSVEIATRTLSTEKHHFCDVLIAPLRAVDLPVFSIGNADEIFELGYQEAKEKEAELDALLEDVFATQ